VRLDRELASGAPIAGSRDRSLRAHQLVTPRTRRRVAASLRAAIRDARSARPLRLGSRVPVCREAVLPLSEALTGLAERLESPAEVNPRGVARLFELITDGTGPLYQRSPDHPLDAAIWEIVDALQLCPPHEWGCPVIMKLEPELVAWTCARCGEMAKAPDAFPPAE
jgi:hypothetical protein